MKKIFIAFLVAVPLLASAEDWQVQAQKDLAAPGGKQYELASAQYQAQILGQIMSKCVQSTPQSFKVYLKLSASGVVIDSMTKPTSQMATCFTSEMRKTVWPKPPFAPYVIATEMFGNPEEFGL